MTKPLCSLFAAVFFGITAAIVWNHSLFLLPVALHLRTVIAGLLPTAAFAVPAYFLLRTSASFQALSSTSRVTWVMFTAWVLAAYCPVLLLTLGILSPLLLLGICGLLLVVSYPTWKRWLTSPVLPLIGDKWMRQPVHLQVFFVISLVLCLCAALLPPLGYDAHEYHLAAAQNYLRHGYWLAFPYNVYAAFPMNVEMLYLYPLAVDSVAGCTVINLQMALLTAWVVAHIAKQAGYPGSWLFPVVLYLSSGIVLRLIVDAKNDPALALCSASLILGYEQLRRDLLMRKGSALSVVLLAMVFGFALGTKYITVPALLFPFMVMVCVDVMLHRQWKWITAAATVCAGALLLWCPWLIRNWVLYQNPVYPLLTGVIGGVPAIFASVFSAAHASVIYKVNHGISPMPAGGLFFNQWIEFFWLPLLKIIWGNPGSSPNALPFGFPFYWVLFPILFLESSWKKSFAFRWMVFALSAYVIWFFLTQRNDRFLASLFPVFVLIPCLALPVLPWQSLRTAVYAALICLVGFQQWSQTIALLREETSGYLFFPSFEPEYYQQHLPHFRAIAWLNEHQRKGGHVGKVLFIGEAQTFGAEFEAVAPTVFNHHPLEQIPDESYTHILYNEFELSRLERGYGPLGWKLAPMLRYWVGQNRGKRLHPVFDAVPQNPGNLVVFEWRR